MGSFAPPWQKHRFLYLALARELAAARLLVASTGGTRDGTPVLAKGIPGGFMR